jgi:DUF3016 family protein
MINGLLKHAAFLVVVFGCPIGASAASNVRVDFVKPENYTDVSFRSMTPESARERLIGELSRTIQDSAAKPLAGYELYVRILDVHMAGRPAFEAPGINSDLRIRNRTTPPKISLQYVVKDRFGKVVAKGGDLLIDPNYREAWARAVPQWLKPGASDSVGISTFPGRRGFRPAVMGDGPL